MSVNTITWQNINEAPTDEPLFLYAEEFETINNPTGIVDGFWKSEEEGWVIWEWDELTETYNTVENAKPTHFALKENPFKEVPF